MNTDKDFFISYNKADREWAEWIAWQLEEAGYTTIIQAWDFSPGRNFVLEMDKATNAAKRTIAVLSPDYFKSGFTPSEWAAAFQRDPKGEQRLLLPVAVRSYDDPGGILGQIVYIDLIGILNESEARSRLLAGIHNERAKPSSISFPGELSILAKPTFPAPRSALTQPQAIPPYASGLNSTNSPIFLNSFSQALQYQDVQNVELHTDTQHFVATCDNSVILPTSDKQCEYEWKDICKFMLADKLEFGFPQYAQRNPPLAGACANLPYKGNFYVLGTVDNKGFVLPISHIVGAVFIFACVTCGSESTWAWKSVYICG